jgi:hypothetical protein
MLQHEYGTLAGIICFRIIRDFDNAGPASASATYSDGGIFHLLLILALKYLTPKGHL